MKRQLIALATTGAFLLAAGAAAADGTYHSGSLKDDAPVEESSCCNNGWGGLYIAGSVGWGFANTDYSHKATGYSGGFDADNDGVTGTIAIGYDRVVRDGILVGVFTDYTFGELDGTSSYDIPSSPPPNTVGLSIDNAWAVGARVGLIRDSILWYATAGYTHARLDTDVEELGDEGLDGYFIGAGFEKMLRDCWSLKVEYRFSDYGKTTLFDDVVTGGGCGTACRNKIDTDNEVHSIRVGLSYKFNAPREQAEYTPLK